MRLELHTYPVAGADLDTGFPKALALLRHMGIKETGSREFCPEGITALLFCLLPVHETIHLWNQQHFRTTSISVDTICSTARSYKSHPSVQMTDFLGAGVNLHFLGPDFSVSPVPYFQPSLSMGWAVHPLTVLTAELPGLLSLLL